MMGNERSSWVPCGSSAKSDAIIPPRSIRPEAGGCRPNIRAAGARLAGSIGPDERRQATRLEGAGQGRHNRQGAVSQLQLIQANGRNRHHKAHATASHTQAIIIAAAKIGR